MDNQTLIQELERKLLEMQDELRELRRMIGRNPVRTVPGGGSGQNRWVPYSGA